MSPQAEPHRHTAGYRLGITAATLLTAVGAVLIGSGLRHLPEPPPQPPASAARSLPIAADGSGASNTVVAAASVKPLPASRPVRIDIPDVRIHITLTEVGLLRDGTIGVPDAADARQAAWYYPGPAPGQSGAAIIVGHVDSRRVPPKTAAFYYLGATRPGDSVSVTRADGTVAVFTVDSVEAVAKNKFPTDKVYGRTDYPALRLITCGGGWTARTGYDSNIIVYAHLTGSRKV